MARVTKTNYREPEHGVSFTIAGDEELECGYVANVKPSNITAEAITAAPTTTEERTERSRRGSSLESTCQPVRCDLRR